MYRLISLLLIIYSTFHSFAPTSVYADPQSSGQNTLHPVGRADLRYDFKNLEHGELEHSVILRIEEKLELSNDLKLAFRADIPTVFIDEEDHELVEGLGDSFFQTLVIQDINSRWKHACGIRTTLPTGNKDETSNEKWDIAPVLGWSVDTPELGHGSFSSFIMRYRFSVLGASERRDINQLEFDIDINLHLENRWFVELTSDPFLDFNNGDKWSVPIGFELGKRLGKSLIFSIEPRLFIVRDASEAQYNIESRIGVFF